MDEPFLPWWLVLLLGMWAVSLVVWQYPSINREIRWWAGLSTVVYLGLIFLALGVRPREEVVAGAANLPTRVASFALIPCFVVTLVASVWMIGRGSHDSRRLSYVILTVSNAAVCALLHATEVGFCLLFVAVLSARPLVQRTASLPMRTWQGWLSEVVQFREAASRPQEAGEFWLVGTLNALLACALIGTVGYSLRVETVRKTPGPRDTVLPARMDLDRHAAAEEGSNRHSVIDLAFGRRADVIVLLGVIVFLNLAMARNNLSKTMVNSVDDHGESSALPSPGGTT